MTYLDKYGRFHQKPCIDGAPSGNNGWIYSAYADKLGIPLDKQKLQYCFVQCTYRAADGRYILVRTPNKGLPPISRDEILGMSHFKFLEPKHIRGWNFCPYELPRFNPITFVKHAIALFKNRDDRNYMWKNNLNQMYRFSFSVPLTDRHFILQNWGKFNLVYWAIAKIDALLGGESGIRFLKYGKSKEAMLTEFPEDHPFRGK